MELINPITFPSSVTVAKEQLSKIAKLIEKYQGNDAAKKFTNAYLNIDTPQSIPMLDKLMNNISGCKDTTDALFQFIKKFPELNPELFNAVKAESYEYEKVLALDRYYDQMKQIMDSK